MPNHTAQLLTVMGDAAIIEQMKKFVRSEDGTDLDHDTFFPLPEKLKGTDSPTRIMTEDEIKKQWDEYNALPEDSWQKKQGRPFNIGITKEQSAVLKAEFGFDNWYDWTNHNYGTKWGIYEQGTWTEDNQICFNSAWSPAHLIIEKLSELYPQLSFVLEAADEGGGFVCRYLISDGESTCEDFEWNSEEGCEVRKNVGYWGDDDEDDVDYPDDLADDDSTDEDEDE